MGAEMSMDFAWRLQIDDSRGEAVRGEDVRRKAARDKTVRE